MLLAGKELYFIVTHTHIIIITNSVVCLKTYLVTLAFGGKFVCNKLDGYGGTLLVAQLVEALRYKPEGRGFDSRWCRWNFSLT